MKIRTLKVSNYCQHKGDHAWSFTGSIVGLLGQNGVGKSNLLRAIKSSVTGDFDRPLDRTLTFGERQGFVELEVEFAPGVVGTIRRSLHKNAASLTFDDPERADIKGAKAVNAAVLELIGTDKTLLDEVVFTGQDELARLLFSSPTENARLAAKFFGVERAVDIERSLSEAIAQVVILPMPGDPVVLRAELETLREAWMQRTWDVDQSPDPVALRAEAAELQGRFTAANEARDALAARERARIRHEETATRHSSLCGERDALEVQVARIPVDRLRELYVREAEKRRLHNERAAAVARHQRLKAERDSVVFNFGLEPTFSDALQASTQAAIHKLRSLEASDEVIRDKQDELLRRTEESDGAQCPVCLKPNHWVEEEVQPILDDQARPRANDEDRQELADLEKSLADDLAVREHRDRKVSSLEDGLARAQAEIDALGEDHGPGKPEKWNDAIRAYDDLRDRLTRLNGEVQRLEQELAAAPALPDAPADLPAGFDPAAAQARSVEINRLLTEDVERRHALERLTAARDAKERELNAAETVLARNNAQARRRETLRRMRASFHPDGAPAELIGRRVARMEPRINEYLAALRMPFRARASQGFNFVYEFLDSPDYPRFANELSGGQRTATSVAFRLAALSSFGASAGLLVLDEASQALDAERVQLFAEMLERLKPLAQQLNVTLLFVSHQAELEPAFDQVIRL